MIDTELNEFVNEMLNVLIKKQEKYKDNWKTCYISDLIDKLTNQLGKRESVLYSNEYKRKRWIHIANYCYFLYTRLEKS